MTKGRIYVTVNSRDKLSSITYYGGKGKRRKTIDLLHFHNNIKGVHVHHGYLHNEKDGIEGATRLTKKENKMVEFVIKVWLNRHRK